VWGRRSSTEMRSLNPVLESTYSLALSSDCKL
jgi:hypothetical protein